MNEFRKGYVLDKMRGAFNAEAKECPRCILMKAKPVAPQMAALPPCRLTVDLNAFTHCGVDIFGPFYVSRLRRIEKWYGMMMTCLTTRSTSWCGGPGAVVEWAGVLYGNGQPGRQAVRPSALLLRQWQQFRLGLEKLQGSQR